MRSYTFILVMVLLNSAQVSPGGQKVERKEAAARNAAVKKAREEVKRRPEGNMPPFGRVALVDQVGCATDSAHGFSESPENASEVRTILGRPCRILKRTKGEAAYFS